MHARVALFSYKPGVCTPLIAAVRSDVLPQVARYHGFLRAELLTRSRINKVILTTYWVTEYDAMQAEADGDLDRAMAVLEPFVAGPAVVEGYEVSIVVDDQTRPADVPVSAPASS